MLICFNMLRIVRVCAHAFHYVDAAVKDTEKSMKRVNSGAYWDAEQWDPDLSPDL